MWSPAECAWQETKLISFFLIESVLFYPSGYQSPVDIILLLVKKKKPWECFKGWQKLTKVKCRQDTSKMPVRWVSRGNHLASTCMHLCTSGNPEKYIHLLAQSAGLIASNWFMKLFPGKPGKRHLHVQSPERENFPEDMPPNHASSSYLWCSINLLFGAYSMKNACYAPCKSTTCMWQHGSFVNWIMTQWSYPGVIVIGKCELSR